MFGRITPVILTFNEAPNITRALSALYWANRIIVVDSGSTDGTLAILKADPRIKVVHRTFDTHAAQWEFAINQTDIDTEWVFRLDADYVISKELCDELGRLNPDAQVS